MTEYPEIFRWFTSELEFENETATQQCLAELQNIVAEHDAVVTIEPSGSEVHFSGSFDFSLFNERFHHVLAKHIKHNWRIKCVFNDPDGFFGGWVEEYHRSGLCLHSKNLNALFEEGFE